MTPKQVARYEAGARHAVRTLARGLSFPRNATAPQITAVLEAMRDELAVAVRILAELDAARVLR